MVERRLGVRLGSFEVAGLAQDARQQRVRVRLAGIGCLSREGHGPLDIAALERGLRLGALCRRNGNGTTPRRTPASVHRCARKPPARRRNRGGLERGILREGDQQRLVRQQMVDDAGQELRLRRASSRVFRRRAGRQQEALEAVVVAGEECQRTKRQCLRLIDRHGHEYDLPPEPRYI